MKKCPVYHKIICFEPEVDNRRCIQERVRRTAAQRIEIYPVGVWDKKDTLYFQGNGSSAKVADFGKTRVEVDAIDEMVKDKVTFIKMDIEGSELRALMGASNIIQRDKPKLAICVYHKPEDIVMIPQYIQSLVPEYKLYLRHYSNYFATETVLYAVTEKG